MKDKKLTPAETMQRLESIEREVRDLRDAIAQSMIIPAKSKELIPETDLQYTLEDLYDAFGKRKHYAIRLKNALEKNGISTLSGFLSLTPGELFELDNVGFETLMKTKKALDRLGVRW